MEGIVLSVIPENIYDGLKEGKDHHNTQLSRTIFAWIEFSNLHELAESMAPNQKQSFIKGLHNLVVDCAAAANIDHIKTLSHIHLLWSGINADTHDHVQRMLSFCEMVMERGSAYRVASGQSFADVANADTDADVGAHAGIGAGVDVRVCVSVGRCMYGFTGKHVCPMRAMKSGTQRTMRLSLFALC
eukprot:TRINITY_DN7014_c0_g1_i15.p1 TRINITY_DN7014_c0_g1~~TRINITY_DN7014_c0_g1_i15.p1  ORF type:complete len:187 (-),score=33.90 TRINITY_DN7014_c0_g1_i15:868-1428(-)